MDYTDLPGVNWSSLKYLWDGSPATYRYHLEHPTDPSPAMLFGRLVHTMVFEPGKLGSEYATAPDVDRRTKEGKAMWGAFLAASMGRQPVRPDDLESAQAIAEAVRRHPAAARLLERGQAEVHLTWTDSATGIECKGKADWVNRPILADLKTCRSCEVRRFWSQAARLGYHCQMAHYSAGVQARFGFMPDVYIIAVESDPPHEVAVYQLTDENLAHGEREVADTLARLKTCRDSHRWPGRYEDVMPSALPNYLFDSERTVTEIEEEPF